MNQEIANICPICGERNPLSNEQCFKCHFKFLEQEELYSVTQDKPQILALLEENIEYFKEKIAFFHNLTGEKDIREAKKSKEETVKRLKALLSHFNNAVLFNKKIKEMRGMNNITAEYKKFLQAFGVTTEELYFVSRENMDYEEYRRRTLTTLGAACFALMGIKASLELGKIGYLEIKSDKQLLLKISEDLTRLSKNGLTKFAKPEDLSL